MVLLYHEFLSLNKFVPTAEVKKSNVISIGFGLDGYIVNTNQNGSSSDSSSSSSISSIPGFLASFFGSENVEVNGEYVVDNALKQAFWEMTYYQTFPLVYTEDGEECVAVYRDWTAMEDLSGKFHGFNKGELAYGGACCPDMGPTYKDAAGVKKKDDSPGRTITGAYVGEILNACEESIKNYPGGNKKDFINGTAINQKTLIPYFRHFYPSNNITWQDIKKLAVNGLLNTEVLLRWGGNNKGRAFRFKLVDGGAPLGKIDVMAAILATSTFENVFRIAGTYNGKSISDAKNAGFTFPFASSLYDYKTGVISGFGPDYIRKIINEIKFEFNATYRSTLYNNLGQKVRVKIFIDEEKKGQALSLVPNLPDELFKPNYDEGQEAAFGTSSVAVITDGSINGKILQWTSKIMEFIVNCNASTTTKDVINYGKNGGCIGGSDLCQNSGSNLAPIFAGWSGKWGWKESSKKHTEYGYSYATDCSHFVTWVLNECGISSHIGQWTSGNFQHLDSQILNSGYKAVKIENEAEIQPGDILVFVQGNYHHVGIASSPGNPRMHYGMGNNSKTKSIGANPGSFNIDATDCFRIVSTVSTAKS